MLQKVAGLPCDAAIFDLEDAVAAENKALARERLEAASVWHDVADKLLMIRINDAESDQFFEDVCLAVRMRPAAIVLPKATEDAVVLADRLLALMERRYSIPVGGIRVIPLIETAYGVCRAFEIARASTRICAMQFGAEDFTRDMQLTRTRLGAEVRVARSQMALACRANGIEAIDTPFSDYKDQEGLLADCEEAKLVGMNAKTCIHPSQIEAINRAFRPSMEEIAWAGRVLEQAELPENSGKGAFPMEGKMIDRPILERARRIAGKAALI